MNKEIVFLTGLIGIILGIIGKPSKLDESPNTATLVFLFGLLFLMLFFIKFYN